jgi:ribonuclease T2
MALLDQLNGSAVQVLFEDAIGQRLRTSAIRAAFDRSFGPGAGERVRVECDREGRILELRIGLKGPIEAGARLADLIQAAPQRTAGCRGGWVDRAGPGPSARPPKPNTTAPRPCGTGRGGDLWDPGLRPCGSPSSAR